MSASIPRNLIAALSINPYPVGRNFVGAVGGSQGWSGFLVQNSRNTNEGAIICTTRCGASRGEIGGLASEDWRADEKDRFLGVGSCFFGEAAVCGGYSEASGTSGCFSETTGTDSKLSAEGTFVGGRSYDLGFGALWANCEPSGRLASPAVPLDGSKF
ncbi:hypothetical protein L2E82_12536 [Cichorium intybus]|uniref:Uncharacterized protein n=1 Tax=Cichorium intybus TaxID=13427 RepID=A0ACB9GH37_CICIN|nr:hypothetical protein L2E82_12536 [Cichorium intybus]